MQDDTIICKIRGRARITLSELPSDDEKNRTKRVNHCTGWIVIKQLSDADYLFLYLKDGELRMRAASLNAVELLVEENAVMVRFPLDDPQSSHRTIPLTSPGTIFDIDDGNEYELLKEAIAECRMLAEYTLRLQSLAKDVYYAGMYSQLGLDSDLLLDEEFRKLRPATEVPSSSSSSSSSQVTGKSSANNPSASIRSHSLPRTSAGTQKVIQLTSSEYDNIECCYYNCNAHHALNSDDERMYFLHPYVPTNFQQEDLFICSLCLTNWREYREKAKNDGELVLEGEFNEELCAVCSDTPQNLIMCASCPRSFCGGCLDRLLTDDERATLQESDEWECMCCSLDIQHIHPSLRQNHWQLVQIMDREGRGSGGSRGGIGRGGIRVKGQGRGQMMNSAVSATTQLQHRDMNGTAIATKGKGRDGKTGLSEGTTSARQGVGSMDDEPEVEDYQNNNDDDEDNCNLMISLPRAKHSVALLSAEMAANSLASSSSHSSRSRHHHRPSATTLDTSKQQSKHDHTSHHTSRSGNASGGTSTTATTSQSMLPNKRNHKLHGSETEQGLVQDDTKRAAKVRNIPFIARYIMAIHSLHVSLYPTLILYPLPLQQERFIHISIYQP